MALRKYYLVRNNSTVITWDEEEKGKLTRDWVLVDDDISSEADSANDQPEIVSPDSPGHESDDSDDELDHLIDEAVSNTFESFSDLQRNADTDEIAYTVNGRAYKHDGARWKKYEEDKLDEESAERNDIDWS